MRWHFRHQPLTSHLGASGQPYQVCRVCNALRWGEYDRASGSIVWEWAWIRRGR